MEDFSNDEIIKLEDPIKLPKEIKTQEEAEKYVKDLLTDIILGDLKDLNKKED